MTDGRILLVDDEKWVLFVLQSALRRLGSGHEIVTAPDGAEALDRLRKGDVDLMITDLHMPHLDGVQLTRVVRKLGIPTAVIWLTAYGCDRRHQEAEQLDVFRCLDKPVEIAEIRQAAREALREGTTQIEENVL